VILRKVIAAALPAQSAPQEVIDRRRAICAACDQKKTVVALVVCGVCNCVIERKTARADSTCPLPQPKW